MKKTGKFLSMILALAMAFALAVPAFADNDLVDVTFSVDPIGTATIRYKDDEEAPVTVTAYVFDQDVLVTTKDGRSFDGWAYGSITRPGIGDGSDWEEQDESRSWFGKDWNWGLYTFQIWDSGNCENSPYMITKTCMDDLIAQGYDVDFHAATQPSQPSTTTPAAKPAPGVSVPKNDGTGEFLYTVKSGDTLSKIAAYYYYNDPNVYKLIYERNKDVIKNPNMIYAGQVITLPSYGAVGEFRAAASKPAQPEQKPAEPAKPAEPEKPTGEAVTYTVKAGDNLSKIAKELYGDATKWKTVYEANKSTISNPNIIQVGQVLTIPAK